VILDAGFFVSVERGEERAREFLTAAQSRGRQLHTTHPVLAQVWRDGSRQARLARLLEAIELHPMDDGRTIGSLLARASTSDVVDAHLVVTAVRIAQPILTADTADIERLVALLPGPRPVVHPWR
jgi:predicted nucleic acid-binding protein